MWRVCLVQVRAGEVLQAAGLGFNHVVAVQLLFHRPDSHGGIELPLLNEIYAESFAGETPLPARTPSTLPSARASVGALMIAQA